MATAVLMPTRRVLSPSPSSRARKRAKCDVSSRNAVPASAPSDSSAEEATTDMAPIATSPPSAADTIAQLTEAVRLRQDFIIAQGNLDRQIKRIVSRVTKKPKVTEKDIEAFMKMDLGVMHAHLLALMGLRDEAKERRKTYDKLAEKLAKRLPVYESFVDGVKGFGAIGLALIVGEAMADLSAYANPAKLWRRFGLHVVGGKACSTWKKGGLSKEDWKAAGYSPRRRSVMFVIVDSLLRNKKSQYYGLYQQFKAREVEKAHEEGLTVASANDIPKEDADKYRSLKHIDLRARRKIAKRLLKDLWRAWNGHHCHDTHETRASTRAETEQGEAPASETVTSIQRVPVSSPSLTCQSASTQL